MYDNMAKESESNEEFKSGTGWLRRFMKRLSLRRNTSAAQISSDQLTDKLVSFVLHVRRLSMKHPYDDADIITMDETPAWEDMISAKTVDDTSKKNS